MMSWTEAHDILFLKEALAANFFKSKPRSWDRGKSWDLIAETLNSIDKTLFKVNQRFKDPLEITWE